MDGEVLCHFRQASRGDGELAYGFGVRQRTQQPSWSREQYKFAVARSRAYYEYTTSWTGSEMQQSVCTASLHIWRSCMISGSRRMRDEGSSRLQFAGEPARMSDEASDNEGGGPVAKSPAPCTRTHGFVMLPGHRWSVYAHTPSIMPSGCFRGPQIRRRGCRGMGMASG